MEKVAHATGRSVSEIVNSIVSSIEEIQISQVAILKPQFPTEGHKKAPKAARVRSSWKIRL